MQDDVGIISGYRLVVASEAAPSLFIFSPRNFRDLAEINAVDSCRIVPITPARGVKPVGRISSRQVHKRYKPRQLSLDLNGRSGCKGQP